MSMRQLALNRCAEASVSSKRSACLSIPKESNLINPLAIVEFNLGILEMKKASLKPRAVRQQDDGLGSHYSRFVIQ